MNTLKIGQPAAWARAIALLVPAAIALLAGPAVSLPAVELMDVPGGGLQPEVAVDGDGRFHLLYFAGDPAGGDLLYAHAEAVADGQPGFSEPVRVNSRPHTAIAIGTVRGGHLALGSGRVHVAWMSADRDSPGMYYTRSDAEGHFEAQRNVSTKELALDGGGSLAADDLGNVFVAWHSGHEEKSRRVWVAASSDSGRTFTTEQRANPVETGACGCCGMRAAARDGVLFMLFRAATESVHRDMQLVRFDGTEFTQGLVHEWELAACPMSTAAIVPGADGSAFLAWETEGQVFWSRSSSGLVGAPTAAPGDGDRRKHPALAVDEDGGVALVWTEGTGWNRGGDLAWQVYGADGSVTEQAGRLEGVIPVWSRAAVVARPGGGFTILH